MITNNEKTIEMLIKEMAALAERMDIVTKGTEDASLVTAVLIYKKVYDKFSQCLAEYAELTSSTSASILNGPELQFFYTVAPQVLEFGPHDTQVYLSKYKYTDGLYKMFISILQHLSSPPKNPENLKLLLEDSEACEMKKEFNAAVEGATNFINSLKGTDKVRDIYTSGIIEILDMLSFD